MSAGAGGGQWRCLLPFVFRCLGESFEAVGEASEECGGHLCITEDAGPLAEAQVGRDDHAGAFV